MSDTIGYVRVSTEQQATEQKLSLGEQRKLIVEHAARLGRVLPAAFIFEDPGVSGATAEGRPGFMAMLNFCEQNERKRGPQGMIIVLNDSRFGRFDDPEEATHWRFVLKRLGWIVRFVDNDEVTDPTARGIMRFLGSATATQYRTNLRLTAKRAARSSAEKGRWQQEAPLGYRRLATGPTGAQRVLEIGQRKALDEYSRLTPGPDEEQAVIRWMFETYAEGSISLGAMSRELEARFPGRLWSKATLGTVLKNPAYVGDVIWCRRVTDKVERLQRTVRDKSEWVVVRDAHPALVSRDLFESVQQRLAGNKRLTSATVGGYPLTGLISCAQCGKTFCGGGGRKGPPGDVDKYRFYRDSGGTGRVQPCPPPLMTLRKSWIENVIIKEIAKHVGELTAQRTIEARTRELLALSRGGTKDRRAVLERERTNLVTQKSRLVAAIARDLIRDNDAASQMAEIRSRIESIDAEIEKSRFLDRQNTSLVQDTERLVRIAKDFPTQVKRLTGSQLREALRPWIFDCTVDKEKRVLTLRLWKVANAAQILRVANGVDVMSLANSRRPGSQENTILRRLTVTRRIPVPKQQIQLTRYSERKRGAK